MSTTPIESRRELFDHFQHTIEGTYDELVDEQELDYGQNMLKSFLVESNIEATELDDRIPVVERRNVDFSLDELVIEGSEQNLRFFLDYEDSRFWKLFTLEKSRPAKGLVDDMVGGVKNGLDRTWFPIELQREITELGDFRDIGVKYEADEVFSDEYIEDRMEFGDLSLQGTGRGTSRLFNTLQENDELRRFLSLSAVGIRREIEDRFVLERVTRDGVFTTRGGDSISLHLDTLDTIKEMYADRLSIIEEKHRISYPSRQYGRSIEGSPVVIQLSDEIEDIKRFVDSIVSAKNPLRLWGAKTQLDEDYWKVKGVDLHNNDKYTIEVSPSWIRLYLDDDACGNTALRINAHLQRHFDSQAELVLDA
jgi:hypothetical protein